MELKYIILFIFNLIILTSLIFLIKSFIQNSSVLTIFNIIKLFSLAIQHITLLTLLIITTHYYPLSNFILIAYFITLLLFLQALVTQIINYFLTNSFFFLSLKIDQFMDLSMQNQLFIWESIYFEINLCSFLWFFILSIRYLCIYMMKYMEKKRKKQFITNFVEAIDLKELQKSGIQNQCMQCSICLLEYEKGDKIIRCQCRHIFHLQCLQNWLDSQNKCPLCRMELF